MKPILTATPSICVGHKFEGKYSVAERGKIIQKHFDDLSIELLSKF